MVVSTFAITPSDITKPTLSISGNGVTICPGRANDANMLSIFHSGYSLGTAFVNFWGVYNNSTADTQCLNVQANCGSTGGRNNDHILVTPNLAASCSVSRNCGIHVNGGSMGTGGSCLNAYGLYVEVSNFGGNKYGAFISGLVEHPQLINLILVVMVLGN